MSKMIWAAWILAFCLPTLVQASRTVPESDSEEVTYDDLVNELASRKKRQQRAQAASAFDDVRVHAGFGLVNSFSTFEVNGRTGTRYQNGLQLSAGVDLFSPNWFAETAWRNFGMTRSGSEEHTLRELDLKFGRRDRLDGPWGYRIQGGIADRFLRLTDTRNGVSINDTTPALLASVGAMLEMGSTASMNFDASARSPVVGRTADKGSYDFTAEVKVSF